MNCSQSTRRNIGILLSGVGLACRAETPEWRSEHLREVYEQCFNWWAEATGAVDGRDRFAQLTLANCPTDINRGEDWFAVKLGGLVGRVASATTEGETAVADALIEVASVVSLWLTLTERGMA